jgi:hypothetical protein
VGWLNAEAFKKVAEVYARVKAAKLIEGPVPIQLSEDETKIDSSIVFDLTSNTLVGFCGDAGAKHKCGLGDMRVVLPDGPDTDGELPQYIAPDQ